MPSTPRHLTLAGCRADRSKGQRGEDCSTGFSHADIAEVQVPRQDFPEPLEGCISPLAQAASARLRSPSSSGRPSPTCVAVALEHLSSAVSYGIRAILTDNGGEFAGPHHSRNAGWLQEMRFDRHRRQPACHFSSAPGRPFRREVPLCHSHGGAYSSRRTSSPAVRHRSSANLHAVADQT